MRSFQITIGNTEIFEHFVPTWFTFKQLSKHYLLHRKYQFCDTTWQRTWNQIRVQVQIPEIDHPSTSTNSNYEMSASQDLFIVNRITIRIAVKNYLERNLPWNMFKINIHYIIYFLSAQQQLRMMRRWKVNSKNSNEGILGDSKMSLTSR